MRLAVGSRLGPYQILGAVGAGGMGEVYTARDTRLDRQVAIKVLPPAAVADDRARARLLREARLASHLNHPHVCTIYDVGEDHGVSYIAMELVEGQTLAACVAAGPLQAAEVLRFGRQLAEALAHAHSRGVIHRDFKSANIVITPERRAKVLDFGLARRVTVATAVPAMATMSTVSQTAPGVVAGTPAYMAPEQLQGATPDARSDIWALGVVLYEMAAGRRPFAGQTLFTLSAAILHEPLPPLPSVVPRAFAATIERCLAKAPAERYQQAADVQAALEAIEAGMAGERVESRARTRAVKLAVLPFANLSGDPEQEYLSDGLTQEMIAQLGRLHPGSLGVIARTSVMRYKKSAAPIDQIGRELGVDYVLEGSAQREGSLIRITTDLIEVCNQSLLWADSFEREFSGILKLQRDVAQNVARALALTLLPSEQARLASVRTVNPEAYEAYLKGSQLWTRMTKADLDAAERYFQLALEKQPGYAAPYAGLAMVWACRQQIGIAPPSEATPKAKAAASRALELDDSLAEAYYARATIRTWSDWDFPGAEADWKRALEINPNLADARAYYSHYLNIVQRPVEAMEEVERALALDPYNPLVHVLHAWDLTFVERHDEAIAAASRAPGHPAGLQTAWSAWSLLENEAEAAVVLKAFLPVYGDRAVEEAFERGCTQRGYVEGLKQAARALGASSSASFLPSDVALLHLYAAESSLALDWLERGLAGRDPFLPYLGHPMFYRRLRSEPRYEALCRRVGLPAYPPSSSDPLPERGRPDAQPRSS